MKKTLKDSVTPPLLEAYINTKPQNEWNQFTKNSARRDQIHKALRSDQGSVCAYCEIDLIPANSKGSADFRVEHFHPKSDKTTTRNWGLEWNNLLAVCHGGSRKDVVDAKARHTKPYTCDVPKANNIWDDVILNPLNLKSGPCLFKFDRSTGLFLLMSITARNPLLIQPEHRLPSTSSISIVLGFKTCAESRSTQLMKASQNTLTLVSRTNTPGLL
ncbi:retron system putative HNH endonuclease [Pseudomonas sp. NIBRBAC000502773]|uniref:retron system putative HNH endonuclease n=1 Tax=Pseudomonas sp. NIBRBAC000502773 TaxID=2590776 RepID=UPI0011315DF5|nr:TIGR02646 family protein [Pseudomonas sp. NIBRBAC000502773]